jgi:hypothetical protein
MQTTVEMTTQQLADRLNVSPRMINIYRAAVEQRSGKTIGTKRGRTTWFTAEEQDLIHQAQAQGKQATPPHRDSATVEDQDNQMIGDMSAIMSTGDEAAIAMGQQIGQRWQALMMQAATTEMMSRLGRFRQQMEEFNTFTHISGTPALSGSAPVTNYLESADDL